MNSNTTALAPAGSRTDMPTADEVAANLQNVTDAAVRAVQAWHGAEVQAVDATRHDILTRFGPDAILAVHAALAAGVSQAALAKASGLSRSTLYPILMAAGHVAALVKEDPNTLSTAAKRKAATSDAIQAVRKAQQEKAEKRGAARRGPRNGGTKSVQVQSWDDATEYIRMLATAVGNLERGGKGRAAFVSQVNALSKSLV